LDIVPAAVTIGLPIGARRITGLRSRLAHSWARPVSIAITVSTIACSSPVAPMANTQTSQLALARAVLDGFERRDGAALRALALDEREFREFVWPELPASRPERNLPFSFVWGDLHQKSEAALADSLAARGGQHYELVGVRFLGEATQYRNYIVRRKTELTVKDANGSPFQLRLFGSIIEGDGRFKVFSYVVD
jgi:hypothetical protein